MTQSAAAAPRPWYRTLGPAQWKALAASNLGWLFDGYETFALILSVGVALRSLLAPSQYAQIPSYAGTVIAITLLGWGLGGLLGGVLADYIGRRRMMIYAILAYSIVTGLSALAWDWTSFMLFRFLVGVAIGSERATGASLTAEIWPPEARGKGAGLMQCCLGLGFFLASAVWLVVSPVGPDSWRYMYLIGVLPALVTLWIRHGVPESAMWQESDRKRRTALERLRAGQTLGREEASRTRFTMVDLFSDPESRRRTIVVFLMSLTTTLAWWGISTWVPRYIGSIAGKSGLPAEAWASYAGMAYTAGSTLGYAMFGFLADAWGRRRVTLAYMVLAWVLTPVLFLWTRDLTLLLVFAFINAIFTNGQYSWMPVWLPELFPTRMRATALAFAFNAPRFVAFLGPLVAGALIVRFGGFGQAAMIVSCIYLVGILATLFLPETRGRPLPD